MATPSRLPALILTICLPVTVLFCQSIGINSSGQAPYSGAILDVAAGDKGMLLPRTTIASITNPAEGMIIYDTDTQRFHYYRNGQWVALLEEGQYDFWFADQDDDGFGYPFNVVYAPAPPDHYVDNNTDCDDADGSVNPDADEICDLLDNDCDGLVDDADPSVIGLTTYYEDADGDGFGNLAVSVLSCFAPSGYVANNLDCNDNDGNTYPSAPEICDNLDNDCDFAVDEGAIDATDWYPDSDADGFGDAMVGPLHACLAPSGYVADNTDCNDNNVSVYPGATEICDSYDNDCDGSFNEDVDCDDGIPCTVDQCNAGTGCQSTLAVGMCYIDNACYSSGESNPGNLCQVCNTANPYQWSNAAFGTPCGTGMVCDGAGVCVSN